MGVPPNGWVYKFVMDNPIETDDFGVPHGTPILGNLYIPFNWEYLLSPGPGLTRCIPSVYARGGSTDRPSLWLDLPTISWI